MLCLVLFTGLVVADRGDIDRGRVRIGPALVQEFQLRNDTSEAVEITAAQSTCGCLAPKLDRRALAPGESATLSVDVNTLSQPAGPIAWTTTVRWRSATRTGDLTLTLRAELYSEVKVEPASLAFHVRRARSVDVRVADSRAKPLTITAAGSNVPGLAVDVLPGESPGCHILRVTAGGGDAGTVQGAVWFTTNDPDYPHVRVPVSVHVPAKTRVAASPSTVFLTGTAPTRVMLRDRESQSVRIDRVETDGPIVATISGATVSVKADAPRWDGRPASAKLLVHVAAPVAETVVINVDIR